MKLLNCWKWYRQKKKKRMILALTYRVPNSALHLEAGLINVEAQMWLSLFRYCLNLFSHRLGPINTDWLSSIEVEKPPKSAVTENGAFSWGFTKALSMISQRNHDIELQQHLSVSRRYYYLEYRQFALANYLGNLIALKTRLAFSQIWFSGLPSELLNGKYKKTYIMNRIAPVVVKKWKW